MTKELIERLYASDVASALTNEAARAIEALQARVADQSAQLTRHTNLIDQLQEERCKLAAELAAARAQEPVSHRYRFIHPISGEPVWRDSSSTWNGQCVQEVQPLFAAPVPPVREPCEQEAPYIGHDCDPTLPDSSKVICPACCTQFRAIPTDVQNLMLGAGFEPPFKATPVREPLSYRDILRIYNEVGPEDGVPYRFAGAIEAITKEQK